MQLSTLSALLRIYNSTNVDSSLRTLAHEQILVILATA